MSVILEQSFSAIVATRNRSEKVLAAVSSVLSSFEKIPHYQTVLIVVDQSTNNYTADALKSMINNSKIVYVRDRGKGLSRARNRGLASADSSIVAFTDDDCEVDKNWAVSIVSTFERNPGLQLMFGAVKKRSDNDERYCVEFEPDTFVLSSRIRDKSKIEGVGANFAFRRLLWHQLGGFDELFGGGAQFRSAEETDFFVRTLQQSSQVCVQPKCVVYHAALTDNEGLPNLVDGYLFGNGAMWLKHLRCRRWNILLTLPQSISRWLFGSAKIRSSEHLFWLRKLTAFSRGVSAACRVPIGSYDDCLFAPNKYKPSEI